MNLQFNIFGSKSSIDADIIVPVKELGTTQKNHELCQKIDQELGLINGKKVNSNLIVLCEHGKTVKQSFKGTPDELNNALLDTYSLHEQIYPIFVNQRLVRNLELKIARTLRCLLTYISRSQYRPTVKFLLKEGDLQAQIAFLAGINFGHIDFLPKGESLEVYKTLAFQIAQTIGLCGNKEIYTKEEAGEQISDLRRCLFRKPEMLAKFYLNQYKNTLLQDCFSYLCSEKLLDKREEDLIICDLC